MNLITLDIHTSLLGSDSGMDFGPRDEINLRVLQKIDPSTVQILKQSPYVVLYSYSTEDASWSKLPFEGTLFIYRLASGLCGYRILNRLNLDSFQQDLHGAADVVETEGYVIHRSGDDIWGLWIWDGEDRRAIYEVMVQAADSSSASGNSVSQEEMRPNNKQENEQIINVDSLFSANTSKRPWTPTTIAM